MTSRRAARKTKNRFDLLSETIDENKDTDTTAPSSITEVSTSVDDDVPPAPTKIEYQKQTDTRLEHMETSIGGIADALVLIHESIEEIRSRQNDPNQNPPPPTFDPNQPIIASQQTSVNTPLTTPTMYNRTPTPLPTHINPPIPPPPVASASLFPNPAGTNQTAFTATNQTQNQQHSVPHHPVQNPPANTIFPNPNVPTSTLPTTPVPPLVPNPTVPAPAVPTSSSIQLNLSHKYWKIARDDTNFEPHRFQSYAKDLKLVDDTLHQIRLFYSKIRHAMHTSFKKHTDILPQFDTLTSTTNFYNILVPANDQYVGFTTIKSIYQWFSDSIYNILLDTDVINTKRTPNAHRIIVTNGQRYDGWKLLFHLLTKRCPFLGGKTMDVASEITLLKLNHSDTIHTFYKRVQDIETKLTYSREAVDKTRLLSFYLKAMATSTIHFHLLQHFISELNLHISLHGSNVAHPTHTCSSIYDYLTTIDAPEYFTVSTKHKNKPHKNSTYKNNHNKRYTSGYSTSTISALEHLPDLMEDTNLINLVDNTDTPPDEDDTTTDTDSTTDPVSYHPIISAFRRSSNIICDACGGRGHHASKCFKRGNNFLPRDVQRRIAAYNAKFGDSPSTDTSTAPEKAYHALPPPDHRSPSQSEPAATQDSSTTSAPTISQLGHTLPAPTLEELLDIELGTPNNPSIQTMHTTPHNIPLITNKSSLLHTILTNKGNVMTKYLNYYQKSFLNQYPPERFITHRQAIYHIDSGANVHATNNKSDFILFHPTKSTINLAAGSEAVCEGFGAMLIQLTPLEPPILLAPVYYCPTAKVSTLSPGAIKVYNEYEDMDLRLLKALEFRKTPTSPQYSQSTTVYNNMDYLALPVIQIQQDKNPNLPTPTINTITCQHTNNQYIHQKFDHRNMQMIINMKRHNLMEGLPSKITKFHPNYHCPICQIANATKVSTSKTSTRPNMKPGEWFCFDYSFWNQKSIRGFTSLLTAICLATRYSFVFPTRNKRPPLATINWFITTLRRQGFPVLYIQTDEGGELGRSTDFLQLLTNNSCLYMGTGRSGSSFNGLVERPNRTIANSVRAKLINAGLPDKFWCYAAEDANFKLRRMLHTALTVTPYQAWNGTKPQYSDMKIWGCHVYIVDTDVTRTKLDNRTYVGLFMKFSATTKIIVYYNPKTQKFGRTSHAYFDELNIGTHKHLPTDSPGKRLVQQYPTLPTDMEMTRIQSDISSLPILHQPAVTFEVYLPPIDASCPIKFLDDEKYGLPYVQNIPKTSPIGQQLPTAALKQHWILGIENEEPIHAQSAHEELTRLRTSHANKKISLTMAPRILDDHNKYEEQRSKFDQMRPILASATTTLPQQSDTHIQPHLCKPPSSNPDTTLSSDVPLPRDPHIIDASHGYVPTISVLVHYPTRPTTTPNIQDCFDTTNPLKSFWIQTVYEQFDKNASYRVFTRPIKKSTLPSNTLILKSVLTPSVKTTDIPHLWKLTIRHCVNGKPMKGMTEYGATRATTVNPDTVRFQIAYCTSLGFTHRPFDCTNAFQCTFENDPNKRIYCYLPPFYIHWHNSRYPHDYIDPKDGPYIIQAAQLIQGSPHAANRWQENLHTQITSLGFIRNNIDHSFYTKHDSSHQLEAMLSITVDDLLLSYKNEQTQQQFYKHLSAAFDMTTPPDISKFKFLSLTIYQSAHGTSIDQTTHINTKILDQWFNNGHTPKTVNTPYPTDKDFELDLSAAPVLDEDTLQIYETRYHGPFNHTIGKLLHVQQWTRQDINFAVTRLAAFTRNPNKPAFQALEHLLFYIHTHAHEPIFYPRLPLGPPQTITYRFSTSQSQQYTLPSYVVYFSDSAFGNILPDRRTMQSNNSFLNGVIISWTANIQSCIAADSTDAELKALFCTVKKLVSFSHFLTSSSISFPTALPTTLYVDNKPAINIVQQNKISNRSRHLDIPVTFSYEKLQQKYFRLIHIDTKLNAADTSTKASTGPIHQRHWAFIRGSRFYPPLTTPHGAYVTPPTKPSFTYTSLNPPTHPYHNTYYRTTTTTSPHSFPPS